MQGNADIVSDLSTLFCGFNPKRVFNGYVFAGIGLNRGFDNDEAVAIDANGLQNGLSLDGRKVLVAGRLGLGCNLRLNDRLAINIEGNANILSDKFNSKKAGNSDWQFNALVGLNIKFGKGYKETKPVYYEPEPVVVETAEACSCGRTATVKEGSDSSTANETRYLFALNSARYSR